MASESEASEAHKDNKPVNKQLPPKKIKTCTKEVIGSNNFKMDIIKETRFLTC